MAKYIVKISRTEWYETTIEAAGESEAWQRADNEIYYGDPFYWKDLQSGETCVYSVEEDK